ncbi:MAG: hypothetical protein AAB779_02515, partial [Patescibacteria group bacterium]
KEGDKKDLGQRKPRRSGRGNTPMKNDQHKRNSFYNTGKATGVNGGVSAPRPFPFSRSVVYPPSSGFIRPVAIY